jgi:uridine phosphorylase
VGRGPARRDQPRVRDLDGHVQGHADLLYVDRHRRAEHVDRLEELARVGATTFIRIRTCGTFLDHVAVGDMAVFDSAIRLDGASASYAPIEFPAVASMTSCPLASAPATSSATATTSARHARRTRSYARHPRPGSSFGGYWQSESFVLARVWGLRAGGISVVLDNVLHVSGESGEFDPGEQIAHGVDHVERLARMGCEAVRMLAEADRRGDA